MLRAFSNLSLTAKLILAFSLFAVPILILAADLYIWGNKDIAFATKENDGVVYLQPVWGLLQASTEGALGQTDAAKVAAGHKALQAAGAQYRDEMGSGQQEAAVTALTEFAADKMADTNSTLLSLNGKVADGSNLTLDPDLDSYYMQDLITVKMPQLLDQAAQLIQLAHAYQKKAELSVDEKAAFLVKLGQFSGLVDGAEGDYSSAAANNPGGAIKPNMETEHATFAGTASAYVAALNAVAQRFNKEAPNAVNLADADKAFATLHAQADDHYKLSGRELVRLLDTRIQNKWIELGKAAVVALLATLLAAVTCFFVTRKMVVSLQELPVAFRSSAVKVEGSAGQVSDMVAQLVAAGEQSSTQGRIVLKNASDAATYVASVSKAVNELNLSINDISKSMHETNECVHDAVSQAEDTKKVVARLDAAASSIGEVVQLINDLADQTSLLALNAAIEAARAGDAGRGFAVVADEVKKLASNTSNATENIQEQVRTIQQVATECTESLGKVVHAITRVQENSTSVSAAVEEQTGVAKQITGSINDAAERVAQVQNNVTGIEEAAAQTSSLSAQVSQAFNGVTGSFSELKNTFERVLLNHSKPATA